MNAGLLNIVKHIVAQYGESILNDPARLKPLIKHQAQNVPQEERRAFGRAVEQGFYRKLKRTAARDRPRVKAALVLRLKAFTGLDAPRCAAAVDILDAVTVPVPKTPRPIKWRIAAPGAAIVIIACLIAAKELYAGRSRLHNGAAAHTPREGVIPQYAREEALRFTAAFLTENAASAADLSYRFFYNNQGEACLEYTVTPKGRYIWPEPTWTGFIWGNGEGSMAEGNTNYTITKQNMDDAAYRMEVRRQDPVFYAIEQQILQIAHAYAYDYYAAYGRTVKYRTRNIKKAVCEGYSKAVAELLQNHALVRKVEVWVSDRGNHAWNVIVLQDGRTLYCDATWYDGSPVDDEGYVVNEPVRDPAAVTFDKTEFNTLGGAVDKSSGGPVAVHFAWGDARRR